MRSFIFVLFAALLVLGSACVFAADIKIDPSKEVYVQRYAKNCESGKCPKKNFNGEKTNIVGQQDTDAETYIAFPLDKVPTTPGNIAKAELLLPFSKSPSGQSVVVSVYRVIDDWSSTGITYDNKPVSEASPVGSVDMVDYPVDPLDVTEKVKQAVQAKKSEISFVLRSDKNVFIPTKKDGSSSYAQLVVSTK